MEVCCWANEGVCGVAERKWKSTWWVPIFVAAREDLLSDNGLNGKQKPKHVRKRLKRFRKEWRSYPAPSKCHYCILVEISTVGSISCISICEIWISQLLVFYSYKLKTRRRHKDIILAWSLGRTSTKGVHVGQISWYHCIMGSSKWIKNQRQFR